MKIMDLVKYFSLLLVTAGIAFGCTTIPTQEMSDARQAVQAARAAGAAAHAPDNLNSAEEHLIEAEKALDTGYYTEAREYAIAAKGEAIKARSNTLEFDKAP